MEQQIINGTTRVIALFGNPVSHSLSPCIHNHAFGKMNLPFVYVPLPVHESQLHIAMHAMRAFNFAGANVTVPYKSKVLSYCDVLSPLSELTGTVNTLYCKEGLLHGTTTDAEGFFKALEDMEYDLTDSDAVLLGTGGTARTLGFALAQKKQVRSLRLVGRNMKKVQALAEEIQNRTGYAVTGTAFDLPETGSFLKTATLLVNCTNVGMHPNTNESPLSKELFHAHMTVFDAVYNPRETLFLRYARESGCSTQNGLRMLLYQAIASFKYWTGLDAERELFDSEELQSLASR
jgi:shikimate dehydrogenase